MSVIGKPSSSVDEKELSELAYEMRIKGHAIKISKKLDGAIEKIYHGFHSLKEACEEAYKICKEDGIPEALISEIIRISLKRKGFSERSVLRYLPDELKDRSKIHSSSLPPTKMSANEGKKHEEQSSTTVDYKSLYKVEKLKHENIEVRFREAANDIESWKRRYEDSQNNLRESPEFKNATRQIELAYEDEINHWRSEYEKINKQFREINSLPKILEFSPGVLKCLDLIFEKQDGILYLQHDGLKVIKVTAAKPIEQRGEIVG